MQGEVVEADEDAFVRSNGAVQWLHWVIQPWYAADGAVGGIVIFTEDISERKRAEQVLRESEERYRIVADYTNDWEYWLAPDGRYLFVSPSCESITGYRPQEFLQNSDLFIAIIHPDDKKMMTAHLMEGEASSGKKHSIEFRIATRIGEVRWIGHSCQSVIDRDGKYLGQRGSNRDITENKKAEEHLRLSQAHYRTLIENIPQAVLLKDRESKYISTNKAYAVVFGLRQEEAIGKTDYDFHPKDLADKFRQEDRLVMETGESKEFNEENIRDGKTRFFHKVKVPVRDNMGKLTGVLSTLSDITERKQAEDALRESEERHRKIIEASTDAMYPALEEGSVIYANRAALKLFRANHPGGFDWKTVLRPGSSRGPSPISRTGEKDHR